MAAKATFDADFGKFIGELTKVEVKLREFGPDADKASAKLQRMADSLNGNKILEQAGVAVNAIKRIDGGVAALNNGELRRYGTLIDAATEKLTRMGRDVPPALAQVKAALDQARKPLDDINKSAGDTTSKLGGLGSAIGTGLGIGAGLGVFDLVSQGVSGIKNAIVETVQEGNKLSQLRTAFESLQGGPGPAAVAMDDLRAATRGLVSDIDLLSAANKASLLGLGQMGIKTDELASIAVRLGKAMGQDAAKSVDDLTTALARQSPQILDNLGIKVDLTSANVKYAASVGKSVDALTDEEKKLAFATAAMDAARAKAETLGEQQLTLSEQISKVGNTLDNMQAGLGAAVNESDLLSGAVGLLSDSLDDLVENTGRVKTELIDVFGPAGRVAGSLLDIATNSEQAANGIKLALLPGLTLVNGVLQGTAIQLDRIAALRELAAGTLSDVQLPGIGRDRTLLDPTAGQNKRANDVLAAEQKRLTEEYIKGQEEALKKIENSAAATDRKLEQLAAKRREALNKLTGRDALVEAQQAIKSIFGKGGVGLDAIAKTEVVSIFDKLVDARVIAKQIEPNAVKGITDALNKVAKHPAIEAATKKISFALFEKMLGPEALRAAKGSIAGPSGAELLEDIYGAPGDFIPSKNPLFSTFLAPVVKDIRSAKKETADWRASLQDVSRAFANLSQITGGALDPVTRQMGTIIAAADAGRELATSLGKLFGDSKFGSSAGGRGLAGGIAGLGVGAQLGGLFPDDAFAAFLAGAGGGAAAGGAAGGGVGAGIGLVVGGVSAIIASNAADEERIQLMRQNREQLLAQFESREDLIAQARRVGISEREITRNLLENRNNTELYALTANALGAAFEREKRQADALAKSLGNVAKVNGVLSRQQVSDVRNALFNDGSLQPTDPRALLPRNPGISSPDRAVEGAGPRGGPLSEAAEGFLRQQGQSLLAGLGRILEQPGSLTPSLVKAVGQSLPAAMAELERQGLSSIDALKTLQPLLDTFREKAVLAGAGSTPGFDALNAQLALLKDERLGPLIERANGAGQALGALQNLGLLNDETFSGFASSITETVAGMDLLSTDGQNAMRLIRQPLQNIWQLQQDFGYEVDAATQGLLDQAAAAGLIGDKFRPVEERLVQGLETIVDRLDKLIDGFTNGFPTAATEGAERAKRGIKTAFDNFEPRVRVGFEYDTPSLPDDPRQTFPEDRRGEEPGPTLPPEDPRQRNPGTAGFDAIRSSTATTDRVGVYIDGRLSGEAILPHLGPILEFNGIQRVNA